MRKPVAEWTEDDVLALPPGENDSFERKGSSLLDLTLAGVNTDDVLNELAKQLSAFANAGGGQLVYGVKNTGEVDNGGIARCIRGRQTTKEWLDDVIPTLTDFEIVGFNVYEIPPKPTGSTIAPGKSLYVVDVPDSERAPHQSKRDLKYYVRLSGRSQPAPHRLVEDIRNRARHPKIQVHDPRIVNAQYTSDPHSSQGGLFITLELGVRNGGRIRAANTALLFTGNVSVDVKSTETREFFVRGATRRGSGMVELKNTSYPEMDLVLQVNLGFRAFIEGPQPTAPEGLLMIEGRDPADVSLLGSERESGEGRILCGFLKNEELGLGDGQSLRLE